MKIDVGILDSAKAEEVEVELRHQWNLLRTDEPTRQMAKAQGIDLSAIDEVDRNPFGAEPAEEGNSADVVTTILIGVAVSLAKDMLKDTVKLAWLKLIKPEIERRFGNTKEPETSTE